MSYDIHTAELWLPNSERNYPASNRQHMCGRICVLALGFSVDVITENCTCSRRPCLACLITASPHDKALNGSGNGNVNQFAAVAMKGTPGRRRQQQQSPSPQQAHQTPQPQSHQLPPPPPLPQQSQAQAQPQQQQPPLSAVAIPWRTGDSGHPPAATPITAQVRPPIPTTSVQYPMLQYKHSLTLLG